MLRVTKAASQYIRSVRDANAADPSAGARFVRSAGGIGLTFANAPDPGDQILSGPNLPLYVPDDLATALAHAIIDVRREDGVSKLVLRPQ